MTWRYAITNYAQYEYKKEKENNLVITNNFINVVFNTSAHVAYF